MRPRSTLLGLLVLALAALALPGAARADALDDARAAGGLTEEAYAFERARSLFALEDVRADHGAVERPDGRAATLLLRDLRAVLPRLRGSDRAVALALLARPGAREHDDPFGTSYDDHPPRTDCGPHVCVHWTETGPDAVESVDRDGNGVPDHADAAKRVLHEVWAVEVGRLGYRPPLDDSGAPTNGGDGRFDVYLADIGDHGYFGYCTTDDPAAEHSHRVSAFCVIENDFSERTFAGMAPLQALRVTAAHEFFHAIQFGYDWLEDTWLVEGSAAWMEDEVYDAVDDNRRFLGAASPLARPEVPLDHGRDGFEYGSWIYWRYLAERFGAAVVRDVWNRAEPSAGRDPYSVAAVADALAARGTSFAAVFASFGAANRAPGTSYAEGRAYRSAPRRGDRTIAPAAPVARGRASLAHLTTRTVGFRRGGGVSATARLRLSLRAGHPAFGARAIVVRSSGRSTTLPLRPSGTSDLPFGRGIRRVELVLSNGGTGYACWRGTALSCRGVALDDGAGVTFRATLR